MGYKIASFKKYAPLSQNVIWSAMIKLENIHDVQKQKMETI